MKRLEKGFTLIELMLTVAIISLLAAIAIPKFANMVDKARIASLKGQLGCLRSALALYYAENEGTMPNCVGFGTNMLPNSLVPRYVNKIPAITWPKIFVPFTTVQMNHPGNSILFTPICSDVNLIFGVNEPYCYRNWAAGDSGSPNQLALTRRFHMDSQGTYFSNY
jgi:prepilin-type N-terminal cleavage/methylation domain-containing protein